MLESNPTPPQEGAKLDKGLLVLYWEYIWLNDSVIHSFKLWTLCPLWTIGVVFVIDVQIRYQLLGRLEGLGAGAAAALGRRSYTAQQEMLWSRQRQAHALCVKQGRDLLRRGQFYMKWLFDSLFCVFVFPFAFFVYFFLYFLLSFWHLLNWLLCYLTLCFDILYATLSPWNKCFKWEKDPAPHCSINKFSFFNQ